MVDQVTAELNKEQREVPKRKVTVKNSNPKGQRFIFDATGKQHYLGPGEEAEIELSEPEAKRLEEASKGDADLRIAGTEPEAKVERLEEAPEQPKEHEDRRALAEQERDLMEEGQEADRERREKAEKIRGPQLAAETGIHMHARNIKPEVIASPPDAPAKKK